MVGLVFDEEEPLFAGIPLGSRMAPRRRMGRRHGRVSESVCSAYIGYAISPTTRSPIRGDRRSIDFPPSPPHSDRRNLPYKCRAIGLPARIWWRETLVEPRRLAR